MRPRQREILAAAARLFRERGLHGTGMRDIAAALDMTAGNLYYYFASKADLLAFCQDEALAGLAQGLRRLARLSLPADTALALATAAHVARLNELTPGSLAHLEVDELPESHRAAIRSRRDAYERALRRLVARGIEEGVFRAEADPRTAVLALLGAVNWTVKWFRPGRGKSARQIGFEFAELTVRGLLAEGREFRSPAAELLDLLLAGAGDAR